MNLSRTTSISSKHSLEGLTILCVEDGKEARNLLSIFLRRQGARIIEAEDGERGLVLYQEYQPDIVISDFRMPKMDGIQMCKAIRESGDDCTPIIFLSAHSEVELLQEAICLSATQYIVKPISFEVLKNALSIATEKLGSQRMINNRLSQLQETVSDYRYQEQRIEHYVTQLVGGNQHQEVRVISRPKSAISGDFYCMEAVKDSLYVMLGDAMGHGLAAILPAMDLPRRFRELAANGFSLPRIADELNQALYQRGMGEYFVTVTLLCMDTREHRLEAINCGNPPMLVYENEGGARLQFPSNHVAMGIVRGDDFCPELQVYRCDNPASIFLYSDGLPETLDSGVPGVSMLRCISVMEQGQYRTLMEDIAGLLEQVPQERRQDDVTLLEVLYRPMPREDAVLGPICARIQNASPNVYFTPDNQNLKWLSVLYVEDDLDALEHLTRYLQRRLGAVHAAANQAEGLVLFDRYRPQLVITDMILPDGDGLQLIQKIRGIDPAVPVILISGMTSWQSRPPLVENLMSLQINHFLVKPLQGDKLLSAIGNCVRRTEYLHKLKLSSSVFMTSPLAITITDKNRNFVSVNPAFTKITGYTDTEVLGCNPKILSSGKHDGDFYRKMWAELNRHGRWSGEIWNRHKNGELFLEWINISVIRDENGEVCNYASVFADITQRLAAEEKMRYLAHHDYLTNLPNRLLLNDRLNQAILKAQREGAVLAVIYLDIDHFKNINDSLGHAVGDELILSVAQALQSVVREVDTVSRLGGDEFAILLPDVGSAKMASRLVAKIFMAASRTYQIAGRELRITLSMGVSLFPKDGENPATLLKHADSAMYLAKKEGRNNFQFFDEALENQTERYMLIQHGLHNALKRGELSIHYQPKYALDEKNIVGAEALLRWSSPELGVVSPAEFIPIAEETGFIVDIGCWLINQVCKTMAAWREQGATLAPVAINVSPIQFHRGNLHRTLSQAMNSYLIDPALIQVELTEGVVMNKQHSTIELLHSIKGLGVAISIDDFGTGYSSLSYLRHLPIDEIKIDRSFIMEIVDTQSLNDTRLTAIPLAIIDLARNLNIKLVAEGVETEVQSKFLLENGCHIIQGYWFSKPVDDEAMLDFWLRA
ncbi:EAL domain-containing protein [Methylomonas methanica]|uniref:Response regulator receiver modulated diguanylate cyclase/phosphodiesterase with PAS/PAC sensor(S) n=1 Tax=Methylomonas methanica (strain DSM 25384 / MC09) TaxID=857087 RepID=G0A1P1_METMM|nr:EAL domain-containing protein [Methylomonas methanica]AEG00102.1 response regulator receiver modulated diguanylate cyclase/phosphodiesterase with PAS/PAC sensor(s) [Methylomonas methanica MC09]